MTSIRDTVFNYIVCYIPKKHKKKKKTSPDRCSKVTTSWMYHVLISAIATKKMWIGYIYNLCTYVKHNTSMNCFFPINNSLSPIAQYIPPLACLINKHTL